ncbi:hypothetical protein [Burkholderia ubonensis]|uniref:hypothetical protein n=1 Tax=Burkholderia ubonensis TaxID=101571 RepID=UPI00075D4CEA|nr:hypothetical protein [Burkholderia ubonensis]KVG89322.1 hypothetical protein WJ36_26980 [Burkholderia ubonensis]KVQ04687.1 hypothetical protein WJ98_08675 [Burkholderia ubonensis]KVV59517.1 hypothetical protein WK82_27745 [Burkholderia ubonensis]KVW24676.1 hypothetical protein WK92_00450 [Burkholderia ubonensis]KVZ12725.1 hypothetical protein WL13_15800 [Burkholderia ubonensis]
MLRLSICAATLVCGAAFATPPTDGAPPALAASNQVFPPLPPFASLPPGAGGDDEVPALAPAGGRHAKKPRHAPPVKRAPEFQAHLVVTEASRAALAAVDKKLDDAMAKSVRDRRTTGAGAAALAMAQ